MEAVNGRNTVMLTVCHIAERLVVELATLPEDRWLRRQNWGKKVVECREVERLGMLSVEKVSNVIDTQCQTGLKAVFGRVGVVE